ncbi:haloacid dehalogenase superfamily, subfamily IA, variant 3 with third motif having DD or ED/haloacid dehalogenase superfamily, subfamily IA, variant 1 with third motif having Dx(3-4)D or Dx(3-4)E [Hymenobacter gelipurpurascens]|uniref:Haloacid dehalogenase superfamily, subfamily IA, variant 3 with third motif having DD or ED/haloacid dehalogenase superfamily, subfamily IA, variant 1 with third motif having Dx(3-4)D or Dx(3-4)E n=1 Tax=Hymenobacter gelipurpurascens TaxID=89968 RepID=A0A212SZQ7_9BACT|nr:HAD family hydrolase [Hymenobacter gelipurpurascens]SNC59283.1 haloacid dehalogenase superfamily, subfamily IA, variant 3 with third motif having DD or ED/haloacid dehalogenase superfamily, subfamily IA, variant 1 with third motif having Dx(3-4)D or Dx(3-4)E [Hymenobacter gelipurpurascens]
MIRTVIFDMDGVIVDTEPVHRYAYFRHFDDLGIQVSDEEYASFTGASTKNVYQHLKEKHGLEHPVEQLVMGKREFFNRAFDEKPDLDLLDGVRTLIEDLHQHGLQLILASSASKSTIDRVMKRFEIGPYFTDLVSGEDFPRSKPDPAIFEHAASLSKAPKTECVVIEDSANGVTAAKVAGLYCIGYSSEHSPLQDLSHADLVVGHFSELTAARIAAINTKAE